MKEIILTLENPFYAYLFGLIQTDGHLYQNTRNRGRLSIELSQRDEELLIKLQKALPFNSSLSRRKRNTNFSEDYHSAVWNVFDKRFRDFLIENGIPCGRKMDNITIPVCKYSKPDYFRGLIDGDGSLGLTGNGFPFISFITKSPKIAFEYIDFIQSITKKVKTSSKNKRDGVFNIAVFKEDAQEIVNLLYYQNCLALQRKIMNAENVLRWKRPETMKRVENRKRWTKSEDDYILSNSVKDAMITLERSQKSIAMRFWRLKSDKQQVTD
ncbi:MAG: LAGLIDADG family homing endonuclease [Acidobacteria bacterium]|nr:LAGLIDADG family homing endonuclease [Acidobacteriota bacterium]